MATPNIRKLSFQLTAFSNISVARAYNFDSGVVSTIFISSTVLYNNAAQGSILVECKRKISL
jgi:hypothetical protein